MPLNPVAYTERIVKSFLRYQLTAYPFSDPRLHAQMRELLSLDETRRSPLLKGPYVSLSRPFREGATMEALVAEGLLHPHLRERVPQSLATLHSHQEQAIRAIAAGQTTLVSTAPLRSVRAGAARHSVTPYRPRNSGYSCVGPRGDVARSGPRMSTVDSEGQ